MTTATAPRVTTQTTWEIDPSHSLVEFSAKHMMFTTVKGRFTGVSGTITANEADPTASSVEVAIDAATLSTSEDQRDGHLRSPDFLDVENYPQITFKSTRVEPAGKDHYKVVGDLTIRGTTREVALDMHYHGQGTNPWGQKVAAASAETTINRRDFGLTWNVALEAGGWLVGDTIKITIEVQARQN